MPTATIDRREEVIPIKISGPCLEGFLGFVEGSLGERSKTELLNNAKRIVAKSCSAYVSCFGNGDVGDCGTGLVGSPHGGRDIPVGTTGLLYGRVQSGKTNAAIATVALALENGFRCFVVLTSDNTLLGGQTLRRFRDSLAMFGPVVIGWEDFRRDPESVGKDLKRYEKMSDTGVVLISTKNVANLEALRNVLTKSGASRYPALIVDDEADNASLNTRVAKAARSGSTEPSAIFKTIGEIRRSIPNHIYIQVTATPQSLLLQGLAHPCRPVFCELIQAGEGYIGGDVFFSDVESPKSLCSPIDPTQLDSIRTGRVRPGKAPRAPADLQLALATFFLGWAQKEKTSGIGKPYTLLIHLSQKRQDHEQLCKIVNDFVTEFDQALRGRASKNTTENARALLARAYGELKRTCTGLLDLDQLCAHLEMRLRSFTTAVVNADNPRQEIDYRPGVNILIGGNRLGRGLTIDGLMVTFYGRDPKTRMADTVHQHARMFGYRQDLLDVTRLFSPPHLIQTFQLIHDGDEGMREAIGDDPTHVEVKPVWVGEGLKATRSNVLNPADVSAINPGRVIYPPNPLWRSRDIGPQTKALDRLLAGFTGDDAYVTVPIDLLLQLLKYMPSSEIAGYTWEDQRVQQVLSAMKQPQIGLNTARLNVRRGKGGRGLQLERQDPPWAGFASSAWTDRPRSEHPDVPTLVVMKEEGSKRKRWDDCPVYVPTLVLPKLKFVFMFNSRDAGTP